MSIRCSECGNDCTGDFLADETHCGDCGHPVSAHAGAALNSSQASLGTAEKRGFATGAAEMPAQRGSYVAEISRTNPGCLIFLIDQSGSMEEPIGGDMGRTKKQVAADAINRLLYNIILRCTKEDGIRNYFDVGAWSYGGADQVRSLFGGGLLSLPDVGERPLGMETRRVKKPDGAGGIIEQEEDRPYWFEPVAFGQTPMGAAFRSITEPVERWVADHPDSFPPVIMNLTDGAHSDEDPRSIVWDLMEKRTRIGNVLVFNCHISKHDRQPVSYPNAEQAKSLTGLARDLFNMSSPLPEPMHPFARSKGHRVQPGARGYVFNADEVHMIEFFEIGTRAIRDRVEAD